VPLSLTLLLVLAGVVLLAFGIGSTGGALRLLGGGAALLVALAASAATLGLFWLGHKANWTSDGPGMLFVMIALVVCAIVAAVGWLFVFGIATRAAAPLDRLPDAPGGAKRVLRLVGFALLALAAVGQGVAAFQRRGRAAHAAPVVAVSFDASRPRLLTLDAGGTLVEWDLRLKREDRRWTRPELAGATAFLVAADRGYAIANGSAFRFEPFSDRPVETIAGARHLALGGCCVVIAKEQALSASYRGSTEPATELAWAEPIRALAAKGDYVAVADRAQVSLLDGRVPSLRTHASVAAPGAITALEVLYDGTVLALDGNGSGWTIDVRRGASEPLAGKASLIAAGQKVFFVSGRELSEYHARPKTVERVAAIGSGARSLDSDGQHVALGFESGEVVLGTRFGPKFEAQRLIRKR
jgi:hypothetical protein